jgi:hypothetical protein
MARRHRVSVVTGLIVADPISAYVICSICSTSFAPIPAFLPLADNKAVRQRP